VFLPIALAFGMVSTQQGVHAAGWILTVLTTLAAALLVKLSLTNRPQQLAAEVEAPVESAHS
jgi:hypothetical protein